MQRLLPGLMLLLLAGCSPKLNVEKKLFDLETSGVTFELQAVKAEQKIYVDATATGGNIDVYVFLTKNKAAVEKDILAKKLGSVIAYAEDKESVSLQATIPGNEEASVWVKATTLKKPTVAVEIRNKPK